MKKCGMILGAVGSIIVYVPILVQSLACFPVNAQSLLVNKSQSLQGNEDQSVKQLYYDSCLSGQKLLYSTLTLFVAPIVLGSATGTYVCEFLTKILYFSQRNNFC